MRALVMVVVMVAACTSSPPSGSSTATTTGSGSAPPAPPPPRLVYGACGGMTDTFVAGPRAAAIAPVPAPVPPSADRLERFPDTAIASAREAAARKASDWRLAGAGPAFYVDRTFERMRGYRRPPPMTKVTIPKGEVTGALEPMVVRRFIKRKEQDIGYCFAKALVASPSLKGDVVLTFTIKADGKVAEANGTGVHDDVATCVADIVSAIAFPKPTQGLAEVRQRVLFKNLEPARPLSIPTLWSRYAPKELFSGGPFEDEAMLGASSPLRAEHDAIVACVRDQKAGVAVVELGGASPIVHDIADATVSACLGSAAAKLATPSVARCSLAFGVMNATEFPMLPVLADPFPAPPPAPAELPVLEIAHPYLLAIDPATPFAKVLEVLYDLVARGDDAIVEPMLRSRAFPSSPVLRGTGFHHAPIRGLAEQDPFRDKDPIPDHAALAILVTADDAWVGYGPDNVLVNVDRDAIGDAIHTLQARYPQVAVVEIAAAAGGPWSDALLAIEAAIAAKLAWELTAPELLSAAPSL